MNRVLLSVFLSLVGLVASADVAPVEAFAREELASLVAKLAENPPAVRFHVGTEFAKEFPEDAKWIGDSDGFAVRRKGDDVYIFANRPRGVLYGVYAFLERNSDLIFARPDPELGTIFTRTKDFVINDADFREKPAFEMRSWWLCSAQHEASELWFARQRCNGEPMPTGGPRRKEELERSRRFGFVHNPGGGHNLHLFMPEERYREHSEFLCTLKDGTRAKNVRDAQLCFSNMECARIAGEEAIKRIDELGYVPDGFQIKTQDNLNWCRCANCMKDIVLPDGKVVKATDENFRSTQFFIWLNELMKVFKTKYPTLRIGTLAYENTAPAPAVRPDDNLVMSFCPYVKNDKFSILDPTNENVRRWKSRIDAWAKVSTNISWREYWGCAACYPRPLANVVVKDLRYLHDELGIRRCSSETGSDRVDHGGKRKPDPGLAKRWDASAMEHWILSRLLWDPHQEVNALRKEYLRRTYRKAAVPMGRFFKIIIDTWYASDMRSMWQDSPNTYAYHYIHKTGNTEKCRAALSEAEELAKGDLPQVGGLIRRLRADFEEWMTHVTDFDVPDVTVPKTGDWEKALVLDTFRFRNNPGRMPWPREWTKLAVRHDGANLFVRFICGDTKIAKIRLPKPGEFDGRRLYDHVWLHLANGKADEKQTKRWSLSVDPDGNRSAYPRKVLSADWTVDCEKHEKDYTITFTLPFATFGIDPKSPGFVQLLPIRIYWHDFTDGSKKIWSLNGIDNDDRGKWPTFRLGK